jgi:20S proteasome subunit alpha 2
MADSRSNYSLTTFNSSGELVQIKHALAAVQAGATSLGIRAANGVVLATEKKLPSTLVDESTVEKIAQLTSEIGATYSGMGPDFRVLTRKARKETQVYYRTYHELVPCSQLVREVATVMQEFTQRGGVRPFGTAAVPGGPLRVVLRVEGERDREKHDQRQDVPGEALLG